MAYIFRGELFVSGSVHHGKLTFWTWTSPLWKGKNIWSKPPWLLGSTCEFSRVYTSEAFLVQDVFPQVWHGNPNPLWKMLFHGRGLRSSTLLTSETHGKSAGSLLGKPQTYTYLRWWEFWEKDLQNWDWFNAYNMINIYNDTCILINYISIGTRTIRVQPWVEITKSGVEHTKKWLKRCW